MKLMQKRVLILFLFLVLFFGFFSLVQAQADKEINKNPNYPPTLSIWQKVSIYLFGTDGNQNIIQRALATVGYGEITWNEFLSRLVSIIIAALICFLLLAAIAWTFSTSEYKDILLLHGIAGLNIKKFVVLYTVLVGALFVFLNLPFISFFKPLLWPLFTDFGQGLFKPFTFIYTKDNGFFSIVGATYALMILRGIALGITSFFIISIVTILLHARRLIIQIYYEIKGEQSRYKAQQGAQDVLNFLRVAQAGGENIRKKP